MIAIEQLKRAFTDKYVKVDANRPELARFRDVVGIVKTVNMSGRALVEFEDYHLNIGWYDIDLSYLTVVPKPTEESKAAAKKAHDKPAGKAAPSSPAKQTADEARPAVAGTKAGGQKMSVAEMMAAARANKGGAGGGAAAAAAAPAAPKAAKPAAPAAAKPAAKPAGSGPGGKLSVAEMLAAARAGKGGATAAPAAEETAEAAPAAEEAPAPVAKAAAKKSAGGPVDRSSMSVADMVAYCREHDGQ